MTILRLFAITSKCRPYQYFFVGLGTSQGIVSVLTSMISCNIVPTTVIMIGRRKGLEGTAIVAILFEEIPDLLQSLRAVFKLFC
jgi:hypothetical protein